MYYLFVHKLTFWQMKLMDSWAYPHLIQMVLFDSIRMPSNQYGNIVRISFYTDKYCIFAKIANL